MKTAFRHIFLTALGVVVAGWGLNFGKRINLTKSFAQGATAGFEA